ncbi:hypothetical protein J6590_030566 [Homalodisca vitripennis]|nr:hypothetical protein J6590_030566 [Homalodisca vitripennis]
MENSLEKMVFGSASLGLVTDYMVYDRSFFRLHRIEPKQVGRCNSYQLERRTCSLRYRHMRSCACALARDRAGDSDTVDLAASTRSSLCRSLLVTWPGDYNRIYSYSVFMFSFRQRPITLN